MALIVLVIHGLAGDHARATSPELAATVEGLRTGLQAFSPMIPTPAVLGSAYAAGDASRLEQWRNLLAGGSTQGARIGTLLASALIARSNGRDEDALAQLRELKAVPIRTDQFYLRSVAAQHEAELLMRRGDREGAKAAADAAREPFQKAGATWYLGELDRRAREAGIE
jgi:hypothetical protein